MQTLLIMDLPHRTAYSTANNASAGINQSLNAYLVELGDKTFQIIKHNEIKKPIFKIEKDFSDSMTLVVHQNPLGIKTASILSAFDTYDVVVVADEPIQGIEFTEKVNINESKIRDFVCLVLPIDANSEEERISKIMCAFVDAVADNADEVDDEEFDLEEHISDLIDAEATYVIEEEGKFNSVFEGYAYLLMCAEDFGEPVEAILKGMKLAWSGVKIGAAGSVPFSSMVKGLRGMLEEAIVKAVELGGQLQRFEASLPDKPSEEFERAVAEHAESPSVSDAIDSLLGGMFGEMFKRKFGDDDE